MAGYTDASQTPKIIGEDTIKFLAGTVDDTIPTLFDTAMDATNLIDTMPQLFPDKEKLTYRTLASTQEKTKLGGRGSVDGEITFQMCEAFLLLHAQLVTWQDATGGCFWLMWYIKSEDRTVAVRLTCDDEIPTPEDSSGGLNQKELSVSNVGDTISTTGNLFEVV